MTDVNRDKWGEPTANGGFTALPHLLLDNQHALDMSSTELVVLLHVIRYWNEPELPHPDVARIAAAMDLSVPSVQRCLGELEGMGHLKAAGDGRYDLSGLVARLRALPER